MAYDQRGNFDGGAFGKRSRGDGNGFGMAPPSKRMMPASQDYGGVKPGQSMSYGGGVEYASPQNKQRQPGMHEEKPSNVLLFTVLNPKYPITVDVMHTICQAHAAVCRIVIFRKNGVQAMVEFETVDDAERAKDGLDGADIYSGCCTLKIQWGKPTRLTVLRNDSDSWDYTNPNLGKEVVKSQPLLPDPKFDPQMYGGPGGHVEGLPQGRRGGPPPQHVDYGYESYPQEPPMDPYRGPPHAGAPVPHNRYPQQRQQNPDQYNEMYGAPARPPMRGPQRPPAGPPSHGQPMMPSEYDEMGQNAGGMLQQGSVLMVYGLNSEKMNCQRLFNLFCLYGNVVRVKFLKSKEGVAMIQLGDNASCQRAMQNLNNSFIFGSKMQLGTSKQAFIQDVPNPVELQDGTPSFMDFMGSRNNRYSTPEAAAKNRIQPASKVLYFYNSPPGLDEDMLRKVFIDLDVPPPLSVKVFPAKSERSSTGLLEWENKGDAIEAIVLANHTQLPNPSGKNPYIMKLCFSGVSNKFQ